MTPAIFFTGLFVVGALVLCWAVIFIRNTRGNEYVDSLMEPLRDRYMKLAFIWYVGLIVLPVIRVCEDVNNPPVLAFLLAVFSLAVGAFAACAVGAIIAEKVFVARVLDAARLAKAKEEFFAPPQASPQLVGGQVTFNPAGQPVQEVGRLGNISIQQAPPKDEGVFAFDPAKFKR